MEFPRFVVAGNLAVSAQPSYRLRAGAYRVRVAFDGGLVRILRAGTEGTLSVNPN